MKTKIQKNEVILKKDIQDIIGLKNLKSLTIINPFKTLQDFLIIYLVLFIIFYSIIYLHQTNTMLITIFAPFIMFLTAIMFNWINVQVHEASHKLLFKNKKLNDLYCDIIIGSWALHDVETYRSTHFKHHSKLHTNEDPDKGHYTSYTGSYRKLIIGFFQDLFSITALKRIYQVLVKSKKIKNNKSYHILLYKLTSQLIIVGILYSFTGINSILYYFLFFIVPLFCIFPLLLRIRVVVQHYSKDLKKHSDIWISRTTISSLFEHFVIGARMDYHFEHHLFPTIPHYNLKKLHLDLLNAGFFDINLGYHTNNFSKEYIKLASD